MVDKYRDAVKNIKKLGFNDDRLHYSFLLYKINSSDNTIISIHEYLYGIRKFKFEKYFKFISSTFNLELFYKRYKDFENLNNVLKNMNISEDLNQYIKMGEL